MNRYWFVISIKLPNYSIVCLRRNLIMSSNDVYGHTPINQSMYEGGNESVLLLISKAIHSIEPDAEVFLFGSRAQKRATPRSDYDIAIDCKKRVPIATMSRLRGALEELPIIQKIDIIDIYRTSEEFRKIAFADCMRIL